MLSHHLRGRLNNFIVSQELAELQEGFICCLQSISLPEINFLRESCDSITQLMDVGVLSLETCIPFIHFPKYACDIGKTAHLPLVTQEISESTLCAIHCIGTQLVSQFRKSSQ